MPIWVCGSSFGPPRSFPSWVARMFPAASRTRTGPAHGVLRPAERRPGEPLLEVGALGAPRTDRGQHFLAHGVRGWLSVVADRRECVGRAIAGLRDDLPPVGVVALREFREQPDERSVGGGLDRVAQRRGGGELGAASLEDASAGDDVAEQGDDLFLGAVAARCHRLTRGPALVGLRDRPVKGLLGGDASGESVSDAVAFVTGEEDEDDRALVTGLGGGFPHGGLARRPFVPHPHGDATAVDHGFVLPPVNVELAGGLARAVGELQVAEGGLDGGHKSFAAELAHARGVVTDGGEAGAVVLLPLGVLLCEKPVGVADPARCVPRRRARRGARARAFAAGRRPRRGPRRGGRRGRARSLAARFRHRGPAATSAR